MKHRFPPRVDPRPKCKPPVIWRLAAAVTVALPALALSACDDRSPTRSNVQRSCAPRLCSRGIGKLL